MKSLAQIAKELGVSTAALSYVYNGKWKEKRLSEEFAAKIRRKLEAEHYTPNMLGRQLRLGRTMAVGMMLPDLTRNFNLGLIRGAEEELAANGYFLFVCNTRLGGGELDSLKNALERNVDGLLVSSATPCVKTKALLQACNASVTMVDNRIEGLAVDWVGSDNAGISASLVKKAFSPEVKTFAYLGAAEGGVVSEERFAGWRSACKETGVRHRAVARALRLGDEGLEDALELLWREKAPDALFVESFQYFSRGWSWLSRRKVKGLRLAGFENPALANFSNDRSSGSSVVFAEQNAVKIGGEAAKLLIRRMKGETFPVESLAVAASISAN